MDYTPELVADVSIDEIENDACYLVQQASNNLRLRVNTQTRYLLTLIDGEKTVSELTILMNQHFNQNISNHEIDRFIKNTLEPVGVLKSNRDITRKDRAPYLNLRITLLPHRIVSGLTRYLNVLFFDRMWYFIGLLLVTLGIVYASTISFSGISRFITPAHIISYMPLALCSCIVHELGHAAACARFGMKAGSIGFGFYLFMPVFYADVSSAWRLSSGKRIIINIAGMYFQLLISFILVIIYAITGDDWMLYASLINIISFLPNLNPFVRYDGYWILTDLLGINNIIQNAEKSFERTRKWFRGKMKEEFPIRTAKDKFLLCYFLINRIVVVLLLSVFFVVNGYSILYFPSRFLNFISSPELLSFSFFKTFILENLVSFLFYILLFSLIKRFFVRKRAGLWL